jgi:hypothetical protein
MTQEPNNAEAATPVDTAVHKTALQIIKPPEPLVLKGGWNRLPDIKRADQLLGDQAPKTPPEIVVDLIHQGTKVVLGGSSKAGKSWLLLQLALCVATGGKFLRWPTKPGRVLYMNLEILAPFMAARLQVIVNHCNLESPTNLDILNLRGVIADFDTVAQQIIELAENGNYCMIIIDPIYKLMGGRSENGAGGVGALCLQLERVAERTGAAVVYAHHFTKGKQTQKKAIDRLSGSGVFGRDADSLILLTDHTQPRCFTLDLILRNLPPQESFVLEWQYPVMIERNDLEPEGDEDAQTDKRARQMLSLLQTEPLTSGEWEEAARVAGIPHATFFRTKAKLQDGGHIIRDRWDKTWSLPAGPTKPK